jgi:hypothetical protein
MGTVPAIDSMLIWEAGGIGSENDPQPALKWSKSETLDEHGRLAGVCPT